MGVADPNSVAIVVRFGHPQQNSVSGLFSHFERPVITDKKQVQM